MNKMQFYYIYFLIQVYRFCQIRIADIINQLLKTKMEEENLITYLNLRLKEKANDTITYRKALTIYESLMETTSAIQNFSQTIANNESNFALFIFGGAYKLLLKAKKTSKDMFNMDSYLLLMGMTVQKVNINTLKTTNLLASLQKQVFQLLTWKQSTPIMIRHIIAILNVTLNENLKDSKNQSSLQIVYKLFEFGIESNRSSIVSKQSSKLVSLIVRNSVGIAKLLAQQVKNTLLQSLQNRSQLYLNNVREVILQFPIPLINDIVYRVVRNLSQIDHSDQAYQNYLSQTYFFIQKSIDKLSASTLQEIIKEFINNIPTSSESDKIVFCYLQALYEVISEFSNKNQKSANKYISSIISIYQQFLLIGGKVQKHALGLFVFLMKNTIKSSLWLQTQNDDIFGLDVQNIELDQKNSHDFGKIICMLKGMLSTRFSNTKNTSLILSSFFQALSIQAFDEVSELIDQIIKFKEEFDEKFFKKLMHSIFTTMSIKKILQMHPISVQGDIASQDFEAKNNLWILGSLQKFNGQEQMSVFGQYMLPVLLKLKNMSEDANINKIRKQAFKNIIQIIWRGFKIFCKLITKNNDYESVLNLVDAQVNDVNESTLQHISFGLEYLCQNLYKKEYKSKVSQKIIKHFATILNLQKNNSKQILRAIKSLSLITSQDYLNRVFQRNITKLIEAKQNNTLNSETTLETNMKNLEILIAISCGINFNDPTVISSYRVSKQELVIKLIQYLIAQKNLFQKKGYKYIMETINRMPESFVQQMIELIESDQKVLSASKHYRIGILTQLWNRLNIQDGMESERNIQNIFNFIKAYLPQILIGLKQTNKRARKQAQNLFDGFFQKINGMGLAQNFIEIMCAGLASHRSEIKVATIYGLSEIVCKKNIEVASQFLVQVFDLVVMLLGQKKPEIYKAVVDFCRKYIFTLQKSKQIQLLPGLIHQLFVADESSKMEHRSILKFFLLKLVKKTERQTIQKMIPLQDRKILSNAIKVENRLKKKKRQHNIYMREQREKYAKQNKQADTQSQYSSHEEVEQNEMKDEAEQQPLQALDNRQNLLLKYDLQKEGFHFQEQKINILTDQKYKRIQQRNRDNDDVVFDKDGFMVVRDDKRKRRQEDQPQNKEAGMEQQKDSRAYLNVKKKVKTDQVHQVKQSGDTFRSNRAGGDVRLKDKPQPYAFIQFNSKALNKRFKKKAQKIFDTIFQRKSGGLKGIKSRVLSKS